MRKACLWTFCQIVIAIALASGAAAADEEIESFLEYCPAIKAVFENSYATPLAYESWTVTHDEAQGSSESRPETRPPFNWPRAILENVEAGDLFAQGLSGTERSGQLWYAWLASPKCLILKGSGSSLTGPDATLTLQEEGKRRELTVGGKKTVFVRQDAGGAADPSKKAGGAACTDPLECQSGVCEGVIPSAFCTEP